MGIKFEFFKAGHGDSILVSTTNETNILIDGGITDTYEDEISYQLDDLDKLDLVVLTHIDNDHICGLIELLNDEDNREKIEKLWFNTASKDFMIYSSDSDNVNFGQGNLFTTLLDKVNHINNIYVENYSKNPIPIGADIKLTLLSPREDNLNKLRNEWKKKDNSITRDCNGNAVDVASEEPPTDKRKIEDLKDSCIKKCKNFFGNESSKKNKSSIAFILEYEDKKFLLLGDADIKVINESLKELGYSKKEDERLEVEFVKLSHHGSANNINSEFLDLVKTDTYIILTDGKHPNRSKYKHPDKEALSLILTYKRDSKEKMEERKINFIFNNSLPIDKKFPRELNEQVKYNFTTTKQNILSYDYDE